MRHRALALVMSLLLWNACDDDGDRFVDDGCADGSCVCRDTSDCAHDCVGPGCDLVCEQLSNCDGVCDDSCNYTCRDASNCSVACAAGCHIVCESVSNCSGSCGEGCNVTCRDLSSCDITMGPGSTGLCDRVGDCNLRCSDDATPTDCGNGRFVCPPASCP